MSIKIIRKTSWMSGGSPLSIFVDGEKNAKINHNQEKMIEITKPTVLLQVSNQKTKSNQLTVKDGDTVEINSSKISQIIIYASLLYPLLFFFLRNFLGRGSLLAILILFLLTLSSSFMFQSFELTIVEKPPLEGEQNS